MFKNYCLLNPLNTIFNFSVKNKTLKRKYPTASDKNICPRKQKVYMPLGYPRQGHDESEKNNRSSNRHKASNQINIQLSNDSFILSTDPSYQSGFINKFEDDNEINMETNRNKNKTKNHIKTCEFYVIEHYTRIRSYTLPKTKMKTRNDLNVRTYQTFTQQYTQTLDDSERHTSNPNLIEDIWSNMSLCRKFQYYWLAANCTQFSKNAFENFLNFYNKLPKYRKKPINLQKLLHIWKTMSYDEKLPFIFETFLVRISASSNLFKEHNMIQLFSDDGTKKIVS